MTINHKHFLDLAFHLAEKNLGQTKLNPSVGTLIVKNGTVISSGVTSTNGRPHSEFNALNKLKKFFMHLKILISGLLKKQKRFLPRKELEIN